MSKSVFSDRRATLVLLSPAALVYAAVVLVPVIVSFAYAGLSGSPLTGFKFVGLANIGRLFSDPIAIGAFFFSIRYAVIVTILQVLVGYALSLFYVFALRRSSAVVRTLVFFPVVLPTVAVGLLFQRLFAIVPSNGVVNTLLQFVGGNPFDWFSDSTSAFWVLILMELWRSAGFYAVLLYAGLLDIPDDVIESARLDGASTWQLIRHVVLPLSLPVLLGSIIFSINGTLKVFDSVVALTNGGPGTSTTPLTLYMFQTSFTYGDYGYGASIALLLTVLCAIVTVFIFRSARRDLTKG